MTDNADIGIIETTQHAPKHTDTQMYKDINTHRYTHTNTHTHKHTHTNTQTHKHTQTFSGPRYQAHVLFEAVMMI